MNGKIKTGFIVFVVLSALVAYLILRPYYAFLTQTMHVSVLKTLFPGKDLETVNHTVDILLLGIAGGDHDGPNLSDSIMVIHYNFDTNRLSTIGLPRDVWSSTLKEKINTAYAIGEAKQKHGGLKLAKAEVGGILGLPIEYGIVISFKTFRDLIDYLGGVDVHVEHAFTDKEYPIDGRENDPCNGDPEYHCRYQTVSFTEGVTHMDGKTALTFVRSRHAVGSEGSDFARSRRQQQVISALKTSIMAILQKHNVNELTRLYNMIDSLVERDIDNQQLAILAKNIVLKKGFAQSNVSLPVNYFIVPANDEYDGQYVLIPPDNDYDTFHALVGCLLEKSNASECSSYLKKE